MAMMAQIAPARLKKPFITQPSRSPWAWPDHRAAQRKHYIGLCHELEMAFARRSRTQRWAHFSMGILGGPIRF
jgi:hypothetical protein